MTREEAIKVLKKNRPGADPRRCGLELCTAVDVAIAALRERDILFEQVRGYCHTCKKNKTDFPCHLKCYGHQRGSAWEWDGGRRLEEV